MAERSKTRIKDMTINLSDIKLPEKYRIDNNVGNSNVGNSKEIVNSTLTNEVSGGEVKFETMVERFNKKKPRKPAYLRPSHHCGHGKISAYVCIKKIENGVVTEVIRVSREEAKNKVASGIWFYCPKKEWKEFIRNNNCGSTQKEETNNNKKKKVKNNKEKKNKRNSKELLKDKGITNKNKETTNE